VKTRACVPLLCVLIAGCGGGGNGRPKPISGPAKDVATLIHLLERATAARNFTTICEELLASATLKQAGGDECPDVLDQRARGVKHPRIRIQSIDVQGARAQVRVRTTATGQDATSDVINLVREKGSFRVLSLGR
jgi:Putative lumazine-binding